MKQENGWNSSPFEIIVSYCFQQNWFWETKINLKKKVKLSFVSSFIFQYRILCVYKFRILNYTPNTRWCDQFCFNWWVTGPLTAALVGELIFWASLLLGIFIGSKLTWSLWANIYTEKICHYNCLKTTIFAELFNQMKISFSVIPVHISSQLYWNPNVYLKRRAIFISSSCVMEIYF